MGPNEPASEENVKMVVPKHKVMKVTMNDTTNKMRRNKSSLDSSLDDEKLTTRHQQQKRRKMVFVEYPNIMTNTKGLLDSTSEECVDISDNESDSNIDDDVKVNLAQPERRK